LAVQRAAAAADVEFLWYSPTPLCLFNPILADLGNKGCSACDGLLSIDARGRVLPCSSCEDPVGDLLREDFSAIWQGARAARYRNKELAHPACRACEHFPFCHGACPLYWNHFGFDELVAARGFPPCPPPRIPTADDPDSKSAAPSGDERGADTSPPRHATRSIANRTRTAPFRFPRAANSPRETEP
jgi:radical SAM protein with 4Fe4S-binding SPASM domain